MYVIRLAYLAALNVLLTTTYRLVRRSRVLWRFAAKHYKERLTVIGRVHAYTTCAWAGYTVPAYRRFLSEHGYNFELLNLGAFPETTKDNYVRPNSVKSRCRYGRMRGSGIFVDESAGSSGRPYNWVRSQREIDGIERNMAGYMSLVFPSGKTFTINAFSMGAWATGTITGSAAGLAGMVKSVGPDLEKIVDTIEFFGTEPDYLICGYPPFLKHVMDRLDADGFAWDQHRIAAMVGGEGMTEALRDYLETRFTKVRSVYGATDITLGIAGETALSVLVRKELLNNPSFRAEVLGPEEHRVPMVFQYNPLENFLEVNDRGELVCTVTSSAALAPKLRYNVGDEGRIIGFEDLLAAMRREPVRERAALSALKAEEIRLPFLVLFGRKDGTISFMGANLYPQDIEYGLYTVERANHIRRFQLALVEIEATESRPTIHIELHEGITLDGAQAAEFANECQTGVINHLAQASRDFAASLAEDPASADIQVQIHEAGTGPFVGMASGLKNKYLAKES